MCMSLRGRLGSIEWIDQSEPDRKPTPSCPDPSTVLIHTDEESGDVAVDRSSTEVLPDEFRRSEANGEVIEARKTHFR